MDHRLPDSVAGSQPHSVSPWIYRLRVPADDPKQLLAANVRRLLDIEPGESGVGKLMALGFSNGNASRILKGETSVGLDLLATLAKALHVEPWQRLTPGLNPDQLPTLERTEFRWPFRSVPFEVIGGLVGTVAQDVERGLRITLETAGVSITPNSKQVRRA